MNKRPIMTFKYKRNGAMHFLRIGRLQITWVWCKS